MNGGARRILLVGFMGVVLSGGVAYSQPLGLEPPVVGEKADPPSEGSGPPGGEQTATSKAEDREQFFKVINFILLVGGLAFLLRKPLAGFFLYRSDTIRKSLEEGRKALEASQAQLRAVEEKLGKLEEEIQAFKASALREIEAERERLRQETAGETERSLEAARLRIESATRAGVLELKRFAADEALKLAEAIVRERLDEASRRQLVNQFIAQLEAKQRQN